MTWTSIRPWLSTVARLVLGVVWIWAGWAKLVDPRGFTQAVRAYDATPEWLSKLVGYGLPMFELCLGAVDDGLHTLDLSLDLAAVEGEQQVALLDVRAIGEVNADDLGGDARLDCDTRHRGDVAERFDTHRHHLLHGFYGLDGYRTRTGGSLGHRGVLKPRAAHDRDATRQGERQSHPHDHRSFLHRQ